MALLVNKDGSPAENLPDSYDNIDAQGNVLYLDEERLKRKEQPEKPIFVNKKNGLGIKNFIVTHVSARSWNWGVILAVFRKLVAWSAFMKEPNSMKSRMYKKGMYFEPQNEVYSTGTVYNLNVDLDESAKSKEACDEQGSHTTKTIHINELVLEDARRVTVPADLIKQAILDAQYIGGMKECLCRAGQDCDNYPHDLACLFLNRGGKVVVDHGMAVELTKEEAFDRVDRAAELGLACQSLWVQVEQLIWGFRNDEMDAFLEVCFCCPCCCVAFNLSNNATRDVKRRFSPTGWTSVVNHDICIGCKHCLDIYCPQDAIHYKASDGKMVVDQENCVGCGLCRKSCPTGAIKIKQTMPMRDNMLDYFREEGRLEIVPGKGFQNRKTGPLDAVAESATMNVANIAAKTTSAVGHAAAGASRTIEKKAGSIAETAEELASVANEVREGIDEEKST
jgi:Pyruvate/2-oxoacid:ferredoxin oxidoreductase delta subunit